MRTTPIHKHMNPDGTIHDQFCRCTSCKPGASRLAMQAPAVFRIKVAMIALGAIVGALLAARLA